jgi:hypothetical protein
MKPRDLAVCLAVLLALAAYSSAKKPRAPISNVNFVVTRESDGKPIRNAAVVLHPVDEDGKQERSGVELKTDPEGKANYEFVPFGKIRIQVLAPGFQTFGEDYEINQPHMDIPVKMKRPAKQYSIYEEHDGEKKPPAEEKKKPD